MRIVFALPLIAFALSACNNGGSVTAENESAESVAKKVAASAVKPLPGRWESKVKLENFEMAGMPPQAKEAMARQMASADTFSSCLTPEQVDQPAGDFFAGGAKGCTYKHFTMAGGKLDAEMTCGKDMYVQTMTMRGSYSKAAYDITINSKSEVEPGKPMTMSLAVASRRVGDCNGKEDITAEDVKAMRDQAKAMTEKAR
jgi:hypothetical protein